jgi:type IV pilus assembly protein PilM
MSLLTSWLASPPPDAAVEITASHVSAATLGARGGRLTVQAYAQEPLPPGAVHASLTAQNITDRAAVAAALRSVFDRMGTRPGRVALIVPDLAAKVSVVKFDRVPERRDDLDQLVRWQVRKAAPFPIEEASVAHTAGSRTPDGGGEFVVVLARRDVVAEYEAACTAAGAYAGLVDIATFCIVNLALASGRGRDGDSLIVHMRPEYTSIAIVRHGHLIFFRNRPEDDEGTYTDVVHQTAMYYQDRLAGEGFSRLLLGGSGRGAGSLEEARRSLQDRLATAVEPIDPAGVVDLPDRLGASADVMDSLAPLAGMLLRTRHDMVPA